MTPPDEERDAIDRIPDSPEFLVVGRIGKPHGIRGEVSVLSLTDRPEWVFRVGFDLLAVPGDHDAPPAKSRALCVAGVRPFRKGYLVGFGGIEDRTEASRLANHRLFAPIKHWAPLEQGEYFHHQLSGLTVTQVDGTEIGTVSDIFTVGPTTLLEVARATNTFLVPFRREFVAHVNLEEGRLAIDPPPGLMDE